MGEWKFSPYSSIASTAMDEWQFSTWPEWEVGCENTVVN